MSNKLCVYWQKKWQDTGHLKLIIEDICASWDLFVIYVSTK